jgi:hypothetical protein
LLRDSLDIFAHPAKINLPLNNDLIKVVRFPKLANYLLGYRLGMQFHNCAADGNSLVRDLFTIFNPSFLLETPKFPTILRQTTFDQENKYWVDVKETHVNFYPRYTPRVSSAYDEAGANLSSAGLVFEVWQNQNCERIEFTLSVDFYGALAKIGRPYVSLLIAFPCALFLLVSLHQLSEWNKNGIAPSFLPLSILIIGNGIQLHFPVLQCHFMPFFAARRFGDLSSCLFIAGFPVVEATPLKGLALGSFTGTR